MWVIGVDKKNAYIERCTVAAHRDYIASHYRGRNVKLFLCLTNQAPRREDVCERGSIAPPFLTSALEVSGKLHALTALPPGEQSPVTIV
jgi:hypothetical protein